MLQDLRHALRSLRKRPGFTLVAVITLTLGVGTATSVFSVVESLLLRPLPFPDAERLVDIRSIDSASAGRIPPQHSVFSLFEIWREDRADFEDLAAFSWFSPVLIGLGPAERITAPTTTANFFTLLGATPARGRLLVPEDDRPGAAPAAVVSHRFWVSRLGGDPNVIGRTITLDSLLYPIVGVTSPAFQSSPGPQAGHDMWLAMGSRLALPEERNRFDVYVVGKLRPGVTPEQAHTRLDAIVRRAWVPNPEIVGQGLQSVVVPLRTAYVGDYYGKPLWLLLSAVALVLLIACANAGSLLVSRAVERGPELAVRLALGASRWRLTGQVLAEAMIVSLAGGALGLLAASWVVPSVVVQASVRTLPPGTSVNLDGRMLAAALAVSLVAGALSALAPALVIRGGRIGELLKASGGPGSLRRVPGARAQDASLVVQAALTLVLLAGAGLLMRSFLTMVRLDLGFDPTGVAVAQIDLSAPRYLGPEQRGEFIRRVLEVLRATPGVLHAAVSTGEPMTGGGGGLRSYQIPGRGEVRGSWFWGVTPEYFRVMRIPLVRGDTLGPVGGTGASSIVLDEAAAHEYFPGEDALGKVMVTQNEQRTVVGVVGNTRGWTASTLRAAASHVYYPLSHPRSNWMIVAVRGAGDASAWVAPLRSAIEQADRAVPVGRAAPAAEFLSFPVARQRFYGRLLIGFAACALALAAAGVFGTASYLVAQRTRELGIRIALGAERGNVIGLVLGRALRAATVGGVLGIIGALATTRLLRSLLFGVEPTDPLVFATVSGVLLGATVLASYLPARRAASIDPLRALRAE